MAISSFLRDAFIVALSVTASTGVMYFSRREHHADRIQAHRFELVDSTGRIAATLEETPRGPHLLFNDLSGRDRLEIGLDNDILPYAEFTGADTSPRLRLGVDHGGNAAIDMSDGKRSRLVLGTMASDVDFSGPINNWGLFLNPNNPEDYAQIWVSGPPFSTGELAGVFAHSPENPRQRRERVLP